MKALLSLLTKEQYRGVIRGCHCHLILMHPFENGLRCPVMIRTSELEAHAGKLKAIDFNGKHSVGSKAVISNTRTIPCSLVSVTCAELCRKVMFSSVEKIRTFLHMWGYIYGLLRRKAESKQTFSFSKLHPA
jgi:hypothetical protein